MVNSQTLYLLSYRTSKILYNFNLRGIGLEPTTQSFSGFSSNQLSYPLTNVLENLPTKGVEPSPTRMTNWDSILIKLRHIITIISLFVFYLFMRIGLEPIIFTAKMWRLTNLATPKIFSLMDLNHYTLL